MTLTTPRKSSDYMNLSTAPTGAEMEVKEPVVDKKEEHRSRFLSDAEKKLSSDPLKTRESLASIQLADDSLWHLQPFHSIEKKLGVIFSQGLSSADAEKALLKYGANKLEEEEQTPIYVTFLLQFANLIVLLLLGASIISLGLQEWVEGIAVLFIITLNAAIATAQERSAANALAALANMSSPQCAVLRDGKQQEVPSERLVPGDIVILTTGDVVPADIRLIESADLKVNEMILTGESEDVSKKYNAKVEGSKKLTADNMVFSSTTVAAGNATGVVCETGMKTRVGSIAMLLKGSTEENQSKANNPISKFMAKHQPKLTPLQRSLHKLGVLMGAMAITICASVFLVGMLRNRKDPKHPQRDVWLVMLMVSVSLAVSAVPEGLPMVVTICLSSGTSDMVKKHVLVRKLAAVETLGAASVICTDKTGTLTEGKMTALKMFGDFKTYDITGKGFTPEGEILLDGVNQKECPQVRATLLSCVLCSNTKLTQEEDDTGTVRWRPFGNSSEAPLVVAAAKVGIWEEYVADQYKRVVEVPFSSDRKMMITVNETPTGCLDSMKLPSGTKFVASVKGAPNYILKNCTKYVKSNGEIAELTAEKSAEILRSVDDLSSQALRVLAVSIKPMEALPYPADCDDVDEKFAALSKPLVFMGLMASIDPERDGVKDSIRLARHASVRTVMITGDYLKTAVAIARNIDLLPLGADADEEATDCTLLRPHGEYLADIDLDEITSRTLVFARAKPEDKIEIVKSLQRQGLVAAMTGDGVNDAPALKEADIGVAMGIAGTEVAKGASDMILTDDNFCSIVTAVEKGRVIYANIQKFVTFLLSTNVGEILLLFTTIASGMPIPLEPLQILILNLFSDGMPAVALSLEAGDPLIMDGRPRPKEEHIIHGRLWLFVIANAIFIASGAMTVFMIGSYWNFGYVMLDDMLGLQGTTQDNYKHKTCERFNGVNNDWITVGNCQNSFLVDSKDINAPKYDDTTNCRNGITGKLPNIPCLENCIKGSKHENTDKEYACVPEGLGKVQAMTFICITTTEVFRAYTVRSFTDPVWVGMFSNKYMQWAAGASIALTVMVTNIPVVMDKLFGFEYIEWYAWLLSFAGAFGSVFFGEILKAVIRSSDEKRKRWQSIDDNFGVVLMEIRNLRHHVERLEKRND